MTASPYPSYKETSLHLLDALPSHWQVGPLKRGYEVLLGKMLQPAATSGNEILAPYLRAANIQREGVDVSDVKEMWITPSEQESLLLRTGDLLVSEGGDVGRCALWKGELDACYYQNSINRVRSNKNSTRFLYYWLVALKETGYVDVICNKSTIAHLTAEKLGAIHVPYPSLPEQERIAEYLDQALASTSQLAKRQSTLIQLMREWVAKQAQDLVTKGSAKGMPTKKTSLSWAPEVPSHWRERRIGHLFKLVKRQNIPDKQVLSVYRDHGVIRKADRDDNNNKTPDDLSLYQLAEPGDLVVNKMKAWQGSLGISRFEGITSPDYAVFQPIHEENSRFLERLFRSAGMVGTYRSISNGIRPGQWRLEADTFLAQKIYLPDLLEQEEIAGCLEEVEARGGKLIEEAGASTRLLQEHDLALIMAAVTGKLDVRVPSTNRVQRTKDPVEALE